MNKDEKLRLYWDEKHQIAIAHNSYDALSY